MGLSITLTDDEMREAEAAARERQDENVRLGRKPAHGCETGTLSPLEMHTMGSYGERAMCKATGRKWLGKGTFRGPDGGRLKGPGEAQVRTSRKPTLTVYRTDSDDARFFFVHWLGGNKFEVFGPIEGHVCKQQQWWRMPPQVRAAAYFVPAADVEKHAHATA